MKIRQWQRWIFCRGASCWRRSICVLKMDVRTSCHSPLTDRFSSVWSFNNNSFCPIDLCWFASEWASAHVLNGLFQISFCALSNHRVVSSQQSCWLRSKTSFKRPPVPFEPSGAKQHFHWSCQELKTHRNCQCLSMFMRSVNCWQHVSEHVFHCNVVVFIGTTHIVDDLNCNVFLQQNLHHSSLSSFSVISLFHKNFTLIQNRTALRLRWIILIIIFALMMLCSSKMQQTASGELALQWWVRWVSNSGLFLWADVACWSVWCSRSSEQLLFSMIVRGICTDTKESVGAACMAENLNLVP